MKLLLLLIIAGWCWPDEQARLLDFSGSYKKGRVALEWTVTGNLTADRFDVEKSRDGKNFQLIAIVFATDKSGDDVYRFYEKVNSKSLFYRVKLINKNQKTEYSKPIYVKKD